MPAPGRASRACRAGGLRESGGAQAVAQALGARSRTASLLAGARRRCRDSAARFSAAIEGRESFDTRMEAAAEGEQIEAAE